MTQKYTRLLVVKLNSPTHDRLKELAKEDRRTLSSLSRIIIEDYIGCFANASEKLGEADKIKEIII